MSWFGDYESGSFQRAIIKQRRLHGKSLFSEKCEGNASKNLPLFEIALILVRSDHIALFVNANDDIL